MRGLCECSGDGRGVFVRDKVQGLHKRELCVTVRRVVIKLLKSERLFWKKEHMKDAKDMC